MNLVVHPSCQTPRPLLSPPRPPSSWVSPKSVSKAPELSLLQTPQIVKVSRQMWNFCVKVQFRLQVWIFFHMKIWREFVLMPWFNILCLTINAVALSASTSIGDFWPRVPSLHPTVHSAQQPEAHTRSHPICVSRALHNPPTPQQRESNHFHRRSRILWPREGHPMDQWGKAKQQNMMQTTQDINGFYCLVI